MHLAHNFCMWEVILLLIGCGLDRPYLHCNWDLILALLQTPCVNNMQWQQESICLLWFHQIQVFFFKVFRFQMCSTLNKFRSPVFPSSQPCWGEIIGNVSAVHYLIHNYTLSSPARSMRISWRLMLILPSLNSQSQVLCYTLCVIFCQCAG